MYCIIITYVVIKYLLLKLFPINNINLFIIENIDKMKKAVIPDGLYVRGGEGNRT